jgi:hypothetical protein
MIDRRLEIYGKTQTEDYGIRPGCETCPEDARTRAIRELKQSKYTRRIVHESILSEPDFIIGC